MVRPDDFFLSLSHAEKAGLFGTAPLPDARYLLAPLPKTPFAQTAPLEGPTLVGPSLVSDFVAAIHREKSGAWSAEELMQAWHAGGDWQAKAALGFPKLWAQIQEKGGTESHWEPISGALFQPAGRQANVTGLALAWELTALLSAGVRQEAQELARNLKAASLRIAPLGWTLIPSETTETAAYRAERLITWKTRFARSVEMRLIPQTSLFWAQTVWRCAYALGMEWTQPFGGEGRCRFVWPARVSETAPLFFVGTNEAHGLLTPEKAARSETVPGLVFYFELPLAPAPLLIFDRMALALNYFAQTLQGRPVTASGAELDGDALEMLRNELEAAVSEMAGLGLAPGSPEAARFF